MVKQFTLVFSLLLLPALLAAQSCPPESCRPGMATRGIGQLPTELQLSEEQQAALRIIREDVAREIEQIHIAEGGDRKLIREIQEAGQSRASEILTEEQTAFLEQHKEERHSNRIAQHKERREQMQATHEALRRHHEEEVRPALMAVRGQLDAYISAEDQQSIARLRNILSQRPERDLPTDLDFEQMRSQLQEARAAAAEWHQTHREDLQAAAELAHKYREQIATVLEPLASQREAWRAATEEIRDRFQPQGEHPRHGRRGHHARGSERPGRGHHVPPPNIESAERERPHHAERGREGRGRHHAAIRFLLLESLNTETDLNNSAPSISSEVSLAPNPATDATQLRYELQLAGPVQISLFDENGRLVRQLAKTQQEAGIQQTELDLNGLSAGKYQVVIESADQRLVQALIIGR